MRLKLVDLQRGSGTKLFEGHQRSSSAFDDQDSNFSSRFEMDGNQIPIEIQTLTEASFSIHEGSLEGSNRFKDLLTSRIEEANGSIRLSKIGNSGATSASTSYRTEMPNSASSYRQGCQEGVGEEEKPCSGRCRVVVQKISEQVRFETEQWSQVLEIPSLCCPFLKVLEMDTYRSHGHSISDPGSTYRTRDEITGIRQERDPLERIRKLVLAHDLATEKELKDTKKEIRKEVDDAIAKAKESSLPDPSELFTNIYVKGYGVESYGADRKELRATLP